MSSLVYTEVQKVLDSDLFSKEENAENYFSYQFEKLLTDRGLKKETLTVEELRESVADLLQDVLLQLKNEFEK